MSHAIVVSFSSDTKAPMCYHTDMNKIEHILEEMDPKRAFIQVYHETNDPGYLTIEAREITDEILFVKFKIWLHETPHWALARIIQHGTFDYRLDQPQAQELLKVAKKELENRLGDITRYLKKIAK